MVIEVARNKPRQKYCVNYKEQGKQIVATWICSTCSEEQRQEVMLCEECMGLEEAISNAGEKVKLC